MLYYVPLEPYKERYTMQLSAARTGWYERNWIKAGVEYKRIEGSVLTDPRTIHTGSVIDAIRRPDWCFNQIEQLLQLAQGCWIKDSDTIFFDDFWTPGIEALPYAFHLLGIKPKMYAYCWAQSVDEFDFTRKMLPWIRPFEIGIGSILDGIFVACPSIQKLLCNFGLGRTGRVHTVGLPFDSEEVMGRMPSWYIATLRGEPPTEDGATYRTGGARKNQVVFSSRWDREKNPDFFIGLARSVKARRPDTNFVVCTSAPKIRSNDHSDLVRLRQAESDGTIDLREGLTKEQYYATLCESKIQFNCADQDWVSFTLLEASTAGCYPIYPNFRSFPETFKYGNEYLYKHKDLTEATLKVTDILEREDLWTASAIKERSWIHRRFDYSWLRMLDVMQIPRKKMLMGSVNQEYLKPFLEPWEISHG